MSNYIFSCNVIIDGILGVFMGNSEEEFDIVHAILSVVYDAIRSLCFFLDSIIYKMIIYVYNWFMMLCQGRLLDSITMDNIINSMISRFALILGLVMFFIVVISFLKMILDPDTVSDKELGAGNVIKKIILVVIMLGVSSTVFSLLYDVQTLLLGNNKTGTNVIQNLLSPGYVDEEGVIHGTIIAPNDEGNYGDFGSVMVTQLFSGFYFLDDSLRENALTNENEAILNDCYNYNILFLNEIITNYNFDFGSNCLNEKTEVEIVNSGGMTTNAYVMRFMSVESVVVGIIVLFMLLSYCVKVAIRMVQLAFLEIISPMAIISYLSPKKDTMFDRWKNVYISTYIDVFVRVAIISFVVYLIGLILNGFHSGTGGFWESIDDENWYTRVFMLVVIILALLSFAKRAPELLKELLPSGGAGSIGFGIGKNGNETLFGALGFGAGALTGGLVSGVGRMAGDFSNAQGFKGKVAALGSGALGFIPRTLGGAIRGGVSGVSAGGVRKAFSAGVSSNSKVNLARMQRKISGTSSGEVARDKIRATLGMPEGYTRDERDIKALNSYSGMLDSLKGYVSNNSEIKDAQWHLDNMQKNDDESDEQFRYRKLEQQNKVKAMTKAYIDRVASGKADDSPIEYSYDSYAYDEESKHWFTTKRSGENTIDISKDEFIISSVKSTIQQNKTLRQSNPGLFRGYNNEDSYESIDVNTRRAADSAVNRTTSQRSKYN